MDPREEAVRQEVAIATKSGMKQVGCVATETPGLVLTRAHFSDLFLRNLGLYTLTHVGSGYAVLQVLPNRQMAELAARWLGRHGIDWTRGVDEVLKDETAARLVKRVRELALAVVGAIGDLADVVDPPPGTRSRCMGRRERLRG